MFFFSLTELKGIFFKLLGIIAVPAHIMVLRIQTSAFTYKKKKKKRLFYAWVWGWNGGRSKGMCVYIHTFPDY